MTVRRTGFQSERSVPDWIGPFFTTPASCCRGACNRRLSWPLHGLQALQQAPVKKPRIRRAMGQRQWPVPQIILAIMRLKTKSPTCLKLKKIVQFLEALPLNLALKRQSLTVSAYWCWLQATRRGRYLGIWPSWIFMWIFMNIENIQSSLYSTIFWMLPNIQIKIHINIHSILNIWSEYLWIFKWIFIPFFNILKNIQFSFLKIIKNSYGYSFQLWIFNKNIHESF